MDRDSCLQILGFLDRFQGGQYKREDKCRDEQERALMEQGAVEGKAARATFTAMADAVCAWTGFAYDRITQWQNSGHFVRYLWCQMKQAEHHDSGISLSLFAEMYQGKSRFRLSIELAVDGAAEADRAAYRRILEPELAQGLTYVSGGNNEEEFRTLEEKDHDAVRAMGLKKVQVSCIITKQTIGDSQDIGAIFEQGVDALMPYYQQAFSEAVPAQPPVEPEVPKTTEEPTKVSVRKQIEQIESYIASKGFTYEDGMIENFYLSLKSKPFVILAGTSGTGKTRLAKLFAEAIGAAWKLVPVRPDWSDSTDLFGHVDLNGHFVPGAVLEFLKEAQDRPSKPHFLCLDEMNLARVEYYMSDFLSVIETRDKVGNAIVSEPLITADKYGPDKDARERYGEIRFPENLYIIGTVNMDETTFPFSRKVLDRANTIEFSYVDLLRKPAHTPETLEKQTLGNAFLRSNYLLLADCDAEEAFVDEVCEKLQKINKILAGAEAHVGYRVRDEICFYMLNNKAAGLLERDAAMDNEIMQKILPRIQGSSASVKEMLCDLFKLCAADYDGYQTAGNDLWRKMSAVPEKPRRYPRSAQKIIFMVRRFEEDGSTSYWL